MARGKSFTRLRKDRLGGPALEFAIVAPVMVMLLLGGLDASDALLTWRRVATAAREIAIIATEMSVQPDLTTVLTPAQAYQASTAIYALFPQLKSPANTARYSVTLSAIVFTATPPGCDPAANCVYTASTAWSYALPMGQNVTRPCGVLQQVPPGAAASLQTVPTAGMTALTSVLVADVTVVYVPVFTAFITRPITMSRSAFMPPRTANPNQYVEYDVANAATDKAVCPGWL
jgi:Flp pilus assembly protein TadG